MHCNPCDYFASFHALLSRCGRDRKSIATGFSHSYLGGLAACIQWLSSWDVIAQKTWSLVVGLQQPTGNWFSFQMAACHWSPSTNASKCYNISAIGWPWSREEGLTPFLHCALGWIGPFSRVKTDISPAEPPANYPAKSPAGDLRPRNPDIRPLPNLR